MKLLALATTLCLASVSLYSQTPLTTTGETTAVDTIILISGKRVPGKILGLSSTKLTFKKQNGTQKEQIPRKKLHKAIYANGRVEKFNNLAFQSVSATDYKAVILTENQADVEGLYALGELKTQSSKNSRNAKNAERSAAIKMQKKAAAMGGVYVLITKNQAVGGYHEVPTHFYEGVVYGFDPPNEDGK